MVFFCYPASKFNKCPKCGQDLVLIPREHSIFGICKTKICRKKEKKMDKKFMYNFKKVGNEYVPETNRADYNDLEESFRSYKNDSFMSINKDTKYIDFAHWMAKYILFLPHVFENPIEDETICQELAKLGVVELKDNEWVYINEKVMKND